MVAMMSLCKYEEPSDSEKEHMKKCRHFEIPGVLVCNPAVFISSVIFLWGFVIASCVEPDYVRKGMSIVAFDWIPEVWTWLYIFSQDFWVVILVWAAIWYGDLKLGNVAPDFSTSTWFSMLFCCGVATGFFWYAVSEPVWHYTGSRNWQSGGSQYGNRDEDAMNAMVWTIYHWGIHGWIPYTTMGAVLCIMTYRRGYPMTIRYCFTPLIGDKVYGWMGDCVDMLSIVTSIAGVCTSLGIGAMQINAGLQRLNHGFYRGTNYAVPSEAKYVNPDCNGHGSFCADGQEAYGIQRNVGTQILIILFITCLATISVALGLGRGIKLVSQFVFGAGCFLSLLVLFMGETYMQLDVMVQATGQYIWYILKLGFHCDAWGRLGNKNLGLGGDETGNMGGGTFMSDWTLFYWGWWISWGPFVGTFIAKISRGRTLRAFIVATLIVPTLYSIFWFGVWGTEGIRLQRMASGSGLCDVAAGSSAHCALGGTAGATGTCEQYSASYTDEEKRSLQIGWNPSCVLDQDYHDGRGKCKEAKFNHWTHLGNKCIETTTWVTVPCGGAADPTAAALADFTDAGSKKYCKDKITTTDQLNAMYNKFSPADQPACFVPLQNGVACISGQSGGDMMYDLLSSYGPRGFSDLLCAIALVTLSLYFVTSSDSGSLVVDILSANGHPEPPLFQRIFWSFTEGATAVALLYSGVNAPSAKASLEALQYASLICGLPYTFIIFWTCQSLAILVQEETFKETGGKRGLDPDRKAFTKFIFNLDLWKNHLVNTLAPGIVVGKTVAVCGSWPFAGLGDGAVKGIWTVLFSLLYYSGLIVPWFGFITPQWMYVGLVLYIGFGLLTGLVRNGVRIRYNIGHGDLMTDIICGIFAPMFAISQLEEQMKENPPDEPIADAGKKETNIEAI